MKNILKLKLYIFKLVSVYFCVMRTTLIMHEYIILSLFINICKTFINFIHEMFALSDICQFTKYYIVIFILIKEGKDYNKTFIAKNKKLELT